MLRDATFRLGETLFGKVGLASCYIGLFLKELALLVKLTPSEHGRPDGTYPCGDAT